MAYKVTLVVPKCGNNGADGSGVLRAVCKTLAREFGGYTCYPLGRGGWLDDDGNLIEEDNYVVIATTNRPKAQVVRVAQTVGQYIKTALAQQAVYCAIEPDVDVMFI